MRSAKHVVLVLVAAALLAGLVPFAAPPVRAANVSIDLYGSLAGGWGLANSTESIPGPTLTVSQGDSVTITLHSTDGFQHEFLIDYNGNGVADSGEPASSPFSSTTTVSFVASQAGTFPYLCLIHPSAMKGTFVVQAAAGASPSYTPIAAGSTLFIVGLVIVVVVAAGAVFLLRRRRAGQP